MANSVAVDSKKTAVIILESPWELCNRDVNRSSVLPFVTGIQRFTPKASVPFEVFHANFYNASSFKHALHTLTGCQDYRYILYVASHGSTKKVSAANFHKSILPLIRYKCSNGARKKDHAQIDGILLGACLTGVNVESYKTYMEGTSLRWMIGYTAEVDWLPATLIEACLLNELVRFDADCFTRHSTLVDAVCTALYPFDPEAVIGSTGKDNPKCLHECLTLVAQTVGSGNKAVDLSSSIWEPG